MVIELCDAWEKNKQGHFICICTNLGYKIVEYTPQHAKEDGKQLYQFGWKQSCAVMGAGMAKQALKQAPGLKWTLGNIYHGRAMKGYKTDVDLLNVAKWIMFPTKPINQEKPYLSWQSQSSMELIRTSFCQLVDLITKCPLHARHFTYDGSYPVYLPIPGCGNGGLDPEDVCRELLRTYDTLFFSRLGPSRNYLRLCTDDELAFDTVLATVPGYEGEFDG